MDLGDSDSICIICHENKVKYTCPACEIKTCSLPCYKSHQQERECSGKVDSNRYLNRSELASDSIHLNRDYNFLTTVDRRIQVGKEDITSSAKNVFKRSKFNHHHRGQNNNKRHKSDKSTGDKRIETVNKVYLNDPATMVKRENTLVVQLPVGMSRSNTNKTGFDKKMNAFVWTIEWVVLDNQGKEISKFLSYRLKETLVLQDAVPMNILRSKISATVEKDGLSFYLHNVIFKNKLIKLDNSDTISLALKDKIVLEYPTIYVATETESLTDRIVEGVEAYGIEEEDESSSDEESDSDSESDSSSEDESDSDSAPEEESSKLPPLITSVQPQPTTKPLIEVVDSVES
ncbi:BCD1 Box C/D snoRNA protein 1 [Candida maltosa Xu316]|uniref:Box C/D snoRNA processing protein, putative n=1 Tax=Candida maltosa (strain Xu316) TaxID=1245528 RepID=M3ILE3_CANMX|nr:Box C/D snoRNA processing protein, putative [Candida maltosa Xu316]